MGDGADWRSFATGGADPDALAGDENDGEVLSERPDSADEWDWGVLVSADGEVIPPGACEGYHGKDNQREVLGDG
jgi:hypothetical protein